MLYKILYLNSFIHSANTSIQHAGVQYILDSVVSELSKDPEKTFIYVEMAYFTRWWAEQNEATKSLVSAHVTCVCYIVPYVLDTLCMDFN